MTLTKRERRLLQETCDHVKQDPWVTFKNGTRHIAVRCRKCEYFFGYRKQAPGKQLEFSQNRQDGLVYDDNITEDNNDTD